MNYKVKEEKIFDFVKGGSFEDYLCEHYNEEEINEEFIKKTIKSITIKYHYGDYDYDYEYAIEVTYLYNNTVIKEIYDYTTKDYLEKQKDYLEILFNENTLHYLEEKITDIQIELNEIADLITGNIK